MQVPNGRDQMSGGVSVPCQQATPVADARWKPIFSDVKFTPKHSSENSLQVPIQIQIHAIIHAKNATNKFDYTTIVGRLEVEWVFASR